MTTHVEQRRLTERDTEILLAIDRTPLTVTQLFKLSTTFTGGPFLSIRSVQDRLHKLHGAGWVRRWRYATASRGGAPEYYKLAPLGYWLTHGADAVLPAKRQFSELGVAYQHHTRSLADFIVQTEVSAHGSGLCFQNFYRENTLRMEIDGEALFPDCAFELVDTAGRQFNFVVELDCGTERIRSPKDIDSWQRKIRLYDRLQDRSYPNRFRLLVVCTAGQERLQHILHAAGSWLRNPQRSLLYGIPLEAFLAQDDALRTPCFRDHAGRSAALVPAAPIVLPQPKQAKAQAKSLAYA